MENLTVIDSPINDEDIVSIASCINKIKGLWFKYAEDVPMDGIKILAAAINKRPNPVSWRKSYY